MLFLKKEGDPKEKKPSSSTISSSSQSFSFGSPTSLIIPYLP